MSENENPDLQRQVVADTELKTWLVDYVGNKKNPENNEVTLEMVIEVIAEDFPEFLLPVAEENFIRGYRQALTDVSDGEDYLKKQRSKKGANA